MIEGAGPSVHVDTAVSGFVRPACGTVEEILVREASPALDEAIAAMTAEIRRGTPVLDETVAAVRAMYRRFGVDPTKTRPSSEALLRRVRRGDAFPRVNTLVDVINWCSSERQLPYGLYDLAAVEGAITIRIGHESEEYPGIRKDVVHLGGRLTLVDAVGPFGNPTSDSWRTRVTTATTRALIVIFAPAALPPESATEALALTRARIATYCT